MMTRQVLFVQGGGENTHDEWDNRLVDSLGLALGADYEVLYPLMPNEADPDYASWAAVLNTEIGRLDAGALVVGHSIGGTILINAIAANPPGRRLGGIFLIATPCVGKGGWEASGFAPLERLGAALPHGVAIYLYHGTADETAPVEHVDLYAKAIPQAVVRRLEGRDHQLGNDLSEVARDIKALK